MFYLKRDLSGVEAIEEKRSINKFMINGWLSLDLYYRINERLNMIARPQFKSNLKSIFKNEYEIDQRYYLRGMFPGLLYSIK